MTEIMMFTFSPEVFHFLCETCVCTVKLLNARGRSGLTAFYGKSSAEYDFRCRTGASTQFSPSERRSDQRLDSKSSLVVEAGGGGKFSSGLPKLLLVD